MAVREVEMETAHQAIEEFVHKALGDVAGALTASLVVIGDKLGLYKALTKGAATPAELASRTGTTERYVREWLNAQAAAGYVVHLFPTGQGNVIGNPIMPVIKITGNPRTARVMSEHIDVDVSGVVRREMTIEQAGDAVIDMVRRTANGRFTAAEALGHREFVMTKLYRSA